MRLVLILIILLAILQFCLSAYCNGSPKPGEFTNDFPILEAKMQLIETVKNGKLFWTGSLSNPIPIVHVYGTPYEMGYAQGQLRRAAIKSFVTRVYAYLLSQIVEGIPENIDLIKPAFRDIILKKGMDAALDWCAKVTAPFTPQRFYDELQGIADASGVSYQTLLRLNMFPEITKASCSFFGAWSDATRNGKTFQLRALDYDTDGPFKDFPQLTIYHPSEPGSNKVLNVAWPGSIGAMTGYSSSQMGLSEIGISYPDDSFEQGTIDTQPEKVEGKPWNFITRDVLQFQTSVSGAAEYLKNSNRTCNLILGFGDGKEGKVNGFQYSGYVLNPYDNTNQLPVNETWHPVIDNIVYNGMDWLCPSFTSALGSQLKQYYGQIDATNVIRHILPTVQTGSLHIVVYDLTDNQLYMSFSRPSHVAATEPFYAYERQFMHFDMTAVFNT